ncbi:retrovirus-related pol polyprotein from transposon TNT 1-94 [Tanacetum coccineum]
MFGSLCYPRNDHDDLGKIKPMSDIGIFIGYSETSRGFRIYNRRTKKIMETIHVKFDKLTIMAYECNNFQDSSEDSQSLPSKSDLDNLFGPLYEEYYATSSQEVSNNSTANTLDNEHTSSSSSIFVEEDEAPQIVSSSAEKVTTKPNSLVLNENTDELVQEDLADFDGNVFYNLPQTLVF